MEWPFKSFRVVFPVKFSYVRECSIIYVRLNLFVAIAIKDEHDALKHIFPTLFQKSVQYVCHSRIADYAHQFI